jgi:hypothetical protein
VSPNEKSEGGREIQQQDNGIATQRGPKSPRNEKDRKTNAKWGKKRERKERNYGVEKQRSISETGSTSLPSHKRGGEGRKDCGYW